MKNKGQSKPYVLWFDEIGMEDIDLVGGKNASLGEMYRNLWRCTINLSRICKIPNRLRNR